MADQAANPQTNHEDLVEKARVVLAEQRRAIQRALEAARSSGRDRRDPLDAIAP